MSKLNYTPLANRVIVKVLEQQKDQKVGSILVPDMAKSFDVAEVVAVGMGEFAPSTGVLIPMELKVGDTVLMIKDSGVPILIEDQWYKLLREGGNGGIEAILQS